MFINNFPDFKNTKSFCCNQELSLLLLKNGFSFIYLENDKYYYVLTEKLKKFLNSINIDYGGE